MTPNVDPITFFNKANELMVKNSPAAADKEMLEKIAAVNIGPGMEFDTSEDNPHHFHNSEPTSAPEEPESDFRQASGNSGIPSSVFFSSLPYSHLIFCSVFSQYDFTSFLYIFRYFCTFSNKNIQKYLTDYFL